MYSDIPLKQTNDRPPVHFISQDDTDKHINYTLYWKLPSPLLGSYGRSPKGVNICSGYWNRNENEIINKMLIFQFNWYLMQVPCEVSIILISVYAMFVCVFVVYARHVIGLWHECIECHTFRWRHLRVDILNTTIISRILWRLRRHLVKQIKNYSSVEI